jgi:hypothetical protein
MLVDVDPVNILVRAGAVGGYNARSIMGYSAFQPKHEVAFFPVRTCLLPRSPERVFGFRLSLSLPCKTAASMV